MAGMLSTTVLQQRQRQPQQPNVQLNQLGSPVYGNRRLSAGGMLRAPQTTPPNTLAATAPDAAAATPSAAAAPSAAGAAAAQSGIDRQAARQAGQQQKQQGRYRRQVPPPPPPAPPPSGTGAGSGLPGVPSDYNPLGQTSDPFQVLNQNLTEGSPYIDVAKQQAAEIANSRGLLNSSIAAGAGERAAIEAAAPFAEQQGSQVAAQQAQQVANAQQQSLQAKDIAAQQALAKITTGSQEKIAASNQASQEKIAQLDANNQANIAQLNADTQTAIANMQVSASEQNNAASTAATMAGTQAQMYASVMSNPNISAADRQAYLASSAAQFSSNIGLIEQLYGIDLSWGSPSGTTPTAATPAAAPATSTPPAGAPSHGGFGAVLPVGG